MIRTVCGTSAATRPHVATLAGQLVSGAPEQRLSWGFQTLINGILATPVPGA